MSITLKLLNEGFEKKYLQEADKRPKSWILFFDEDGVNRAGSDGSRPSDLLPAKAEKLLQSSDYSIPSWAKSYVILTDNQFMTIDYDSLEKFHDKYGKEIPTNESLKEEWIHFQYKSGANPYIAKNQKEAKRIIKKYGKDKIKELRKGFYEIDDSEESFNQFMPIDSEESLEEDTTYKAGPFEFSSNLGSKALDTASNIFGKTVDNIEPIVKNIGPIAGAISKVAPLLADDASEKKEVFRNDNGENYDVIERSKTGKNALLNKGKQWIVASDCPEENEGSWGQGHYFFNEKSARNAWENGYLDESLKEDKLSKFPRKKIKTEPVLADDFNEKNLNKISTLEYEANPNRQRRIDLYRKYAHLDEDVEITEDNIDDWALGKVACRVNREPAKVKAEILGQRYSDYEKY